MVIIAKPVPEPSIVKNMITPRRDDIHHLNHHSEIMADEAEYKPKRKRISHFYNREEIQPIRSLLSKSSMSMSSEATMQQKANVNFNSWGVKGVRWMLKR